VEANLINDLWYKNAVVYCLSVETFMDSNGDGVGDFQGLQRRLDYLAGLGVNAIWLMPFQTFAWPR
jgi:maltose alpha-D-glucosyltransferase/alpha-amylase